MRCIKCNRIGLALCKSGMCQKCENEEEDERD